MSSLVLGPQYGEKRGGARILEPWGPHPVAAAVSRPSDLETPGRSGQGTTEFRNTAVCACGAGVLAARCRRRSTLCHSPLLDLPWHGLGLSHTYTRPASLPPVFPPFFSFPIPFFVEYRSSVTFCPNRPFFQLITPFCFDSFVAGRPLTLLNTSRYHSRCFTRHAYTHPRCSSPSSLFSLSPHLRSAAPPLPRLVGHLEEERAGWGKVIRRPGLGADDCGRRQG